MDLSETCGGFAHCTDSSAEEETDSHTAAASTLFQNKAGHWDTTTLLLLDTDKLLDNKTSSHTLLSH